MKTRHLMSALALALFAGSLTTPAASAQSFMGQIKYYAFNFCPRDTAPANGALLPIGQNAALFSLYSTNFGGDGRTTFALPDLQGRVAVGFGEGPGLPNWSFGQQGGDSSPSLTVAQMPPHSHDFIATTEIPNVPTAVGNVFATFPGLTAYADPDQPTVTMNANTVQEQYGATGQEFSIQDPVLALSACVTLNGVYPSRT